MRWFRLLGQSLRELRTDGWPRGVLHLELLVRHYMSMHARSLVVRSGDCEDAFSVRVDDLVRRLDRGCLLLRARVNHAHQWRSGRLLEGVLSRNLQ